MSPSGDVLQSFLFSDAFGPEAVAVAPDGSVFLAGQERPGTKFGALALPDVPDGYYLLQLSSSFDVVAATMVQSPATQVNALYVDAHGDLLVATAVASFEAGSMHPVVTKYSGDTLSEVWSTVSEHDVMPALAYGLTMLPNGHVVAAGVYARVLKIGPFVLEKPVQARDDDFIYNGWLAWFSSDDGRPLAAETFGGAQSGFALDVQVTSAGSLRLLTTHSGGSPTLFGKSVALGDHRSAVIDLDSSGNTERLVHFGDVGTGSSKMALGRDGQTYIGGRYGDPQGDVSARGALLTRIEPDGALGPTVTLSTGNGVTRMAVDTLGGVWLSGRWETPFQWNGETYRPTADAPGTLEPCRFLVRLDDF